MMTLRNRSSIKQDAQRKSVAGSQDGCPESHKDVNKVENSCGTCWKQVLEDEQALLCEVCQFWHHIECEKVSEKKYNFLKEDDSDDIHWFCRKCNRSAANLYVSIAKLDAKITETDKRVESLNDKVDDLETRVKVNTNGIKNIEGAVDCVLDDKMEIMQQEILERDKRRRNIMIFGVEESKEANVQKKIEHDMAVMQGIGQTLGIEECKVDKVVRVGKPNDKPRPMKVILEERRQRDEFLRSAKNLGNTKWRHCHVKPDLTPMERAKEQALWEDLKKRIKQGEQDLVIRKGKIVKRAWTSAAPERK